MAIDPTQLAEDQEARQRANIAGAPTEFAKGPEQEGIQVAGLGSAVLGAARKLLDPSDITKGITEADGVVPTPQERPLVEEGFDELQRKQELAPQVLSPEGVKEFEERGFVAAPDESQQAVREAREAVGELLQEEDVTAATEPLTGYEQAVQQANEALEGKDPEVLPIENPDFSKLEVEAKSITEGGDFNLDFMQTDSEVKELITAVSENSKQYVEEATRGRVPNAVTVQNAAGKLADELGFTKQFLDRRIEDGLLLPEELIAAREIFVAQGEKVKTLAEKITAGAATPSEKLKFRREMAVFYGVHLHLKGFQAETGRALQSFQVKVGGEEGALAMARAARASLDQSGGDPLVEDMAEKFLHVYEEKGLSGIGRFINKAAMARTADVIAEAYMAGLLTSPATQFKNIISNAAWMTYQLPADVIAGLYGTGERAIRRGLGQQIDADQAYMQDAALRLKGYIDSMGDAFKAGSIAFRTEMPAVKMKGEIEGYGKIRVDPNTPLSGPINFIGKGIRIPFRLLTGADEFFKTISQRGELYVQANKAYQNALMTGKSQADAMDEAGMVLLDPSSFAKELNATAKYNTLQDDVSFLGMDITKAASSIQRFSLGPIPIGRWILPFAQTPTNSFIKTAEFAGINPKIYSDLAGTPKQRQKALARLTMAAGAMSFVHVKLAEGKLTGAMPSDPKAREALPPGWQPYSFVFKGEGWPEGVDALYDERGIPNGPLTYVSYSGFEPVGGVLAFMTTAHEAVFKYEDEAVAMRAAAAVGAIADYYRELPMLQGISDMASIVDNDSLSDMLRDAPHLFRGPIEATSVFGFPNVLSALQRAGYRVDDPTQVYPRADFEYYTLEEITALNEDGTYKYATPDGKNPDYRLVGMPKIGKQNGRYHSAEEWNLLKDKIAAIRSKDSLFQDEMDYNAPRYDTLGREYGAEDVSFAVNPKLALFNIFTGIRIRPAEKPTNVEIELSRLHADTGEWALSNKRSHKGMRLSKGGQSDFTYLAKNIATVDFPGAGEINFMTAMEKIMTTTDNRIGKLYSSKEKGYRSGSKMLVNDAKRIAMIQHYEEQYYEAAWEILMTDPRYQSQPYYANLKEAYLGREQAQEEVLRRGIAE